MQHDIPIHIARYWSASGITPRPGVAPQTIMEFESRHSVVVPDAFARFYAVVDGMDTGEMEENWIFFYPLHAILPITRELITFSGIPDYSGLGRTLPDADRHFVFADYLITSHVYTLRLGGEFGRERAVFRICGEVVEQITPSFGDFLEGYAADPEAILFS